MKEDVLVVGAGFSGAVIAHELAKAGHKVLVIDKRSHIGGNCYTERDAETGVNVHKYGPHILHTGDKKVWDYVNRFTYIKPFTNRVKAVNREGVFSFPINLHTLNQFFSKRMRPFEAEAFLAERRVDYGRAPQNFEEAALSKVGPELYEVFLKHYTIKQWGRDPKEISASVAARLPYRFNYDDNYYLTEYQGIPVNGYTDIFERLLHHENIVLSLDTPYENDSIGYWYTFYTGPIDEFFGWKHGRLQYRTVEFETIRGEGELQGNAVLNYTDNLVKHTRTHEHKYFAPWEKHEKSLLAIESSKETGPDDDPYYPVRTSRDKEVLVKYQAEASQLERIEFLGRLGSYRYYSMCDTIGQALRVAHAWLQKRHG
jgi:UDP-galactopyranose mutase